MVGEIDSYEALLLTIAPPVEVQEASLEAAQNGYELEEEREAREAKEKAERLAMRPFPGRDYPDGDRCQSRGHLRTLENTTWGSKRHTWLRCLACHREYEKSPKGRAKKRRRYDRSMADPAQREQNNAKKRARYAERREEMLEASAEYRKKNRAKISAQRKARKNAARTGTSAHPRTPPGSSDEGSPTPNVDRAGGTPRVATGRG
jgi:hypothetical protein